MNKIRISIATDLKEEANRVLEWSKEQRQEYVRLWLAVHDGKLRSNDLPSWVRRAEDA